MTLAELRKVCIDILSENGFSDPPFEFRLIARHVTGRKREDMSPLDEICDDDAAQIIRMCSSRRDGYPLQYMLGTWPFMDLELYVGEGVLIPRQDTEAVVETAVRHIRGMVRPLVMDLCSGTGAIALAIREMCPNATVMALEKEDEAYSYLTRNIEKTGLAVLPIHRDVFRYDDAPEDSTFDVIISNPPYIDEKLEGTLQKELSWEPRSALYTTGGGLRFFRYIAAYYKRTLKDGGLLIFEFGSDQADEVEAILRREGYDIVERIRDASGNDRGTVARNRSRPGKIL